MTTRRGLARAGRHQAGASAVEYAIIVAGMAIAIVAVLGSLQGSVRDAYVDAGAQLDASAAPTGGGGPATSAPATSAPADSDPETSAPATSAPATSAPATSAPATSAPATSAPATSAPATSAPATSSAPPAPTQPPGSTAVKRGTAADGQDIAASSGAKLTISTSPANQGSAVIVGSEIVFTPNANATPGLVTVTWTLTKGNKTTTGTLTYWVTT